MISVLASSAAAPISASRRAGPACAPGVAAVQAPPALSAAPEANTSGSVQRASCQAGTAVLTSSAAV